MTLREWHHRAEGHWTGKGKRFLDCWTYAVIVLRLITVCVCVYVCVWNIEKGNDDFCISEEGSKPFTVSTGAGLVPTHTTIRKHGWTITIIVESLSGLTGNLSNISICLPSSSPKLWISLSAAAFMHNCDPLTFGLLSHWGLFGVDNKTSTIIVAGVGLFPCHVICWTGRISADVSSGLFTRISLTPVLFQCQGHLSMTVCNSYNVAGTLRRRSSCHYI